MIRTICYLATLLAVLSAETVFAQLRLSPEEIDVSDVVSAKQIRITFAGNPVLPGEITKIVSGVTKSGNAVPQGSEGRTHFSDYSHMFNFEIGDDGLIVIKPRKGLVEMGTYDLFVHAVHGTVKGLINANLRDSIPPVTRQPSSHPGFSYAIELPDYVYGQAVSVELNPDSKNIYSWYVDGELHSSGLAETSFRAWPEPGDHEISYIARNPDGQVVSTWSDTIKVVEEEAVPTTVRKGYKLPFSAPNGYSQVTWTLDDKLLAEKSPDRLESDSQVVAFSSKGTHILTCFARGSESGDFRRITWLVTVK